MINIKLVVIWLALLLIPGLSQAEKATSYLCIVEEATGFYFENGKWGRAHFDVDNSKYIIRKLKAEEFLKSQVDYTYGVFSLGKHKAEMYCKKPNNNRVIYCRNFTGEINFSTKTGRFIKTYAIGYWDGIDNNENTPNIARGRCSKI